MELYLEKSSKWVPFDPDWSKQIPSILEELLPVESFQFKYSLIREEGLYGYIQNNFEIVVAPRFLEARTFSEYCSLVFDGDRWGIIDLGFKITWIQEGFEKIRNFVNHCAVFSYYMEGEDPKTGIKCGQNIYGLIDSEGKIILKDEYDFIGLSRNSSTFFEYTKRENYHGLVNSWSCEILPPRYSTFQFIEDQLIQADNDFFDVRDGKFRKISADEFYTLEKEVVGTNNLDSF